MGVAASESVTGIAGSVAHLSDVTEDGCTECLLDQGELDVYPLAMPARSDAEAASVIAQGGHTRFAIAQQYQQELSPGTYLVCTWSSCANVEVTAGHTSTVNVKLRNGRTSFFVLDAKHTELVEDFGLDVLSVEREN